MKKLVFMSFLFLMMTMNCTVCMQENNHFKKISHVDIMVDSTAIESGRVEKFNIQETSCEILYQLIVELKNKVDIQLEFSTATHVTAITRINGYYVNFAEGDRIKIVQKKVTENNFKESLFEIVNLPLESHTTYCIVLLKNPLRS